jgi:hypothetical protein
MSYTRKLVIFYDARNNVYTVCGHNLYRQEAEEMIAKCCAKSLHALSVGQLARHTNPNLDTCRRCRRDVARASGLEPKPKFQRRNST